MAAGYYDFEIEQGADFTLAVNYQDTASATIDLSTYSSGRMQIRESTESSSYVIELTTGNGRLSLDQSDPNITLTLSNTETASLDFDHAVFDLEIVASGGEVTKILRGNVKLIREVTK
jgi:hypothetical protein